MVFAGGADGDAEAGGPDTRGPDAGGADAGVTDTLSVGRCFMVSN